MVVLYRYELRFLGRDVYFSDAEVYWDTTLKLLNGIDAEFYNMGYIYYCFIIQKTSFFISPVLINISNLLLVNLSILILAYLLIKNNIKILNVKIILILLLFNPLIYFSLFRNLKDALFLFYVVVAILVVYKVFETNIKLLKILGLVVLVILTDLLFDVRPWGFLIPPLLIFTAIYYKKIRCMKLINQIWFIAGLATLILLGLKISGYYATLQLWVPIVLSNALQQSIFNVVLSPASLIMGPGPIRSIFGKDYFEFYLNVGNIFSAVGSYMWWVTFPFLLLLLFKFKKIRFNMVSLMLFIVTIVFIAIYAMQYGGSAELRFRGILYILITSTVLSIVPVEIKRIDLLTYSVFAVTFFGVGILMSI